MGAATPSQRGESGDTRRAREPSENPLGQAIRDCWTLAATLIEWLVTRLTILKPPWRNIDTLVRKTCRAWQGHLSILDLDRHPWQFAAFIACGMGVLVPMGLMLSEGPPPSFSVAVKVIAVFFSIETAAVLAGFALFGGYLGLRPGLKRK